MKKGHVHSMDYYAYQSPLRQWNPHFKAATALFILIFCIAADRIAVSLYIAVTMAAVNIRGSRISGKEYGRLLRIPLLFIILGCGAIALDMGYTKGGWYIRVTPDSLLQSIRVMLRSFAAVSVMYGLALSTPVSEGIAVLRSLHTPKIIIELMNMIYRYIFILIDTECRYRNAADARLGYVDFKTSCRTFGKSMANLLVVSMKKAGMYYDAMVSRGYEGDLLFLEEEKKLRLHHVLAVVIYGASVTGILVLAVVKGR